MNRMIMIGILFVIGCHPSYEERFVMESVCYKKCEDVTAKEGFMISVYDWFDLACLCWDQNTTGEHPVIVIPEGKTVR